MNDTLRIDIEYGKGGTSDDGTDLFQPNCSVRIEITKQDILFELKNHRKEILRLVNNKLKEIGLHANRNET